MTWTHLGDREGTVKRTKINKKTAGDNCCCNICNKVRFISYSFQVYIFKREVWHGFFHVCTVLFVLRLLWVSEEKWDSQRSKHPLTLCSPTPFQDCCLNKFVPTSGDDCPCVPLSASKNSCLSPPQTTAVFNDSFNFWQQWAWRCLKNTNGQKYTWIKRLLFGVLINWVS